MRKCSTCGRYHPGIGDICDQCAEDRAAEMAWEQEHEERLLEEDDLEPDEDVHGRRER